MGDIGNLTTNLSEGRQRDADDEQAQQRQQREAEAAAFIETVAVPAFEAFKVALLERGRQVWVYPDTERDFTVHIEVRHDGQKELGCTLHVNMNGKQSSLYWTFRMHQMRGQGGFRNQRGNDHLRDTVQSDVERELWREYTERNRGISE